MILYFADRNLNILATASAELPSGIRILSDSKSDSIETGTKTFSCVLMVDESVGYNIREYCKKGNFLLRSAENENEFYTIIETEYNTGENEFSIYAEDAGLNMLNTLVPAYTAPAEHDMGWYIDYYITNYAPEWEIGIDESPDNTLTLTWDGEATLTERLLSIATNFNSEISFSYKIKGLDVTNQYIDIYEQRGNKKFQRILYLNKEVKNIAPKESIADMATAFYVTGGTPEGKEKPITLNGANYSSDGETTHSPADPDDPYQIVGDQVRCIPAMSNWKSKLDPDGLIVRQYQYDTLNKQELFSHSVAELRKVIDGTTTYTVDFNFIPDDVHIGDWVAIVDDNDEIYVEARVLKLEISTITDTQTAELGDFIIRAAGLSERLSRIADELKARAIAASNISIASSGGEVFHNEPISTILTAVVYFGTTTITNQSDLENVFGDDAVINWYNDSILIGTGFTCQINSLNYSEQITAVLEA